MSFFLLNIFLNIILSSESIAAFDCLEQYWTGTVIMTFIIVSFKLFEFVFYFLCIWEHIRLALYDNYFLNVRYSLYLKKNVMIYYK